MKKMLSIGIAAILSSMLSIPVLAGNWEIEDPYDYSSGYHYVKDDGSYAKNEWIQDVDGSWYFFNRRGNMVTNEWTSDGYYVNEKGKMVTNTVTPDNVYVGNDGKPVETTEGIENLYDHHVKLKTGEGHKVEVYYNDVYTGKTTGISFKVDSVGIDQSGELVVSATRLVDQGKTLGVTVSGNIHIYHQYTDEDGGWTSFPDRKIRFSRKNEKSVAKVYLNSVRDIDEWVLYIGKPRFSAANDETSENEAEQ